MPWIPERLDHEETGDTQSSDVEEVTILEETIEETAKLQWGSV